VAYVSGGRKCKFIDSIKQSIVDYVEQSVKQSTIEPRMFELLEKASLCLVTAAIRAEERERDAH
jgi:hypothetical protein